MPSINPVNIGYVMDAIHQDRMREIEHSNLVKIASAGQPASQKIYAPVLASLGRGLMAVGARLQADYQPEPNHTPTRA